MIRQSSAATCSRSRRYLNPEKKKTSEFTIQGVSYAFFKLTLILCTEPRVFFTSRFFINVIFINSEKNDDFTFHNGFSSSYFEKVISPSKCQERND